MAFQEGHLAIRAALSDRVRTIIDALAARSGVLPALELTDESLRTRGPLFRVVAMLTAMVLKISGLGLGHLRALGSGLGSGLEPLWLDKKNTPTWGCRRGRGGQ